MNPPETRDAEILAAGAVLWRETAAGTEVALIHRPKYDDWTIPKGKLKKREHLLRAARREVREETGLRPRLGRRLSPSFYDKDGRGKRVDYWAATVDTDRPATPLPPEEVDRMEWLPLSDAANRLSYDRDAKVLADFADGPAATVPLILARHAVADWCDDDALRPLSPTGRAQATALARLLSCFGPATAIAATAARCVETLLPYAIAEHRGVTTETAFTPGLAKDGRTQARLDELLALAEPAIICGDEELLADLITDIHVRLDAPVPADRSLPEAGFLVLHLAQGRIVATERHISPLG